MKIAIGCDEAALQLKNRIVKLLNDMSVENKDFGVYDETPVLYPDIAHTVALAVKKGEYDRGILICGTGIGMAITANKVHGIRAAQCHDVYSAERAALSNDAHIITLGARVIGSELAATIVRTWIGCNFAGGPSQEKIDRIKEYEQEQ